MIPTPSRRLLAAIAFLVLGALGLLVFPKAWPVLVAINAALLVAALLDLLITPR